MKHAFALALIMLTFGVSTAQAHCQIPCGIYDDAARFATILEHTKTIEKSMNEIIRLSNAEEEDYHMITRWTVNKEEHAQLIQDIAAEYFLAQRVKAPKADSTEDAQTDYVKHTTLLHQIIVAAMKSKQTTDTEYVGELRRLTKAYKAHYFKEHGHAH